MSAANAVPGASPAGLLGAYLEALGISAGPPATALLRQVVQAHLAQLPFASMSVRLHEVMSLELPELFTRLVVRRRGGYCFEQNRLLQAMLEELGYRVRLVMARVIYDQDIHPGLTHRLMLVTLEGVDWLVDVGFGALGPRVPVPMSGDESVDGWRRYRVAARDSGEFHLQLLKDGGWYSLYRFELHRYGESDCELGHFYSHRHPAATFVNHLVVVRLLSDRVLSLRNREFRILTAEGEELRAVEDARQLQELLTATLGLTVTAAEAESLFSTL